MIAATAIAAELPLYTTNPDDFAGLSGLRFQDLQKFCFAEGYAAARPGWMPRWLNSLAMSVRRCS